MTLDLGYIIIVVIAYTLGCFPTAYLLVRLYSGKDIRREGSGNMGGMNSYEVTGNKLLGIAVGLIDALKGYAAVSIALAILPDFFAAGLAGVFVVLGHCFNAFMGWQGGRGLATAAGVALAVNPLVLLLWCMMYLTGYIVIRRDIHVGNIAGTIATPVLLYTTPTILLSTAMRLPQNTAAIQANTQIYTIIAYSEGDITQFKLMSFLICMSIFIRHLEPMRELLKNMKKDED